MTKCTGSTCKVIGDVRKGCAAVAVDAKHPCGSFGWAINSHLGNANISVQRCAEFGAKNAWSAPGPETRKVEIRARRCLPTSPNSIE
jgi:hypothetical protein